MSLKIRNVIKEYLLFSAAIFILANFYIVAVMIFALMTIGINTIINFNLLTLIDFGILLILTLYLIFKFRKSFLSSLFKHPFSIISKYLIYSLMIYLAYSVNAYQGWWRGDGEYKYNNSYWYLINRTNPIYPFDNTGWAIISSTSYVPSGYMVIPFPFFPRQNQRNNIVTQNTLSYFVLISLLQGIAVTGFLNRIKK